MTATASVSSADCAAAPPPPPAQGWGSYLFGWGAPAAPTGSAVPAPAAEPPAESAADPAATGDSGADSLVADAESFVVVDPTPPAVPLADPPVHSAAEAKSDTPASLPSDPPAPPLADPPVHSAAEVNPDPPAAAAPLAATSEVQRCRRLAAAKDKLDAATAAVNRTEAAAREARVAQKQCPRGADDDVLQAALLLSAAQAAEVEARQEVSAAQAVCDAARGKT